MTAAVRDVERTIPEAGVIVFRWAGLDGDDTGYPVMAARYADKCVSFGTYGGTNFGGVACVLQGTNDPRGNPNHADHANAVWFTLTDPQANNISKSAAAIEQVLENPLWIRPYQTGGTGGSLEVILTCVRKG